MAEFLAVKPEPFVLNENAAVLWPEWKQEFKLFMRASRFKERKEEFKVSIFLNIIGKEGRRLFNSFGLDEDTTDLESVFVKFDEHCAPLSNVVMERFKFLSIKQKMAQSFDEFLTELRLAVRKCEYGDQEESITRDQIIMRISDSNLRTRLLREPNIKIEKVVSTSRAFEVSKFNACLIDKEAKAESIDALGPRKMEKRAPVQQTFQCNKCGYRHAIRACPAFNKNCAKCRERHHFAKCCPQNVAHNPDVEVAEEEDEDPNNIIPVDDPVNISTLYTSGMYSRTHDVHVIRVETNFRDIGSLALSDENAWFEPLLVNDCRLVCKLDCGAAVNVLPLIDYKRVGGKMATLQRSTVILMSYGNNSFRTPALGTVQLPCQLRNGKCVPITFVVADVQAVPLLGFSTLKQLGLIKRIIPINDVAADSAGRFLSEFGDLFVGLGKIPGSVHLQVKANATPVIHPPRRVPLALLDRLKRTLAKMENDRIITRVSGPCSWVNPLVIVEKKNGELRLCLDPKDLNSALILEPALIPSPVEILARLSNQTTFTVIDMRCGFWHVELDEESSELCTFSSPFGNYRFHRLPFGLSVSPEIFTRKVQEIFCDLDGVLIYFDDTIISGSTPEEHDRRLRAFMERARQSNVRFNGEKSQFCLKEVEFVGMRVSAAGVTSASKHVETMSRTEPPQTKKELERFLGVVKYLSRFIPHASELTVALRELATSKVGWSWEAKHTAEFVRLKKILSSPPVLKFFDPTKPVVIQADASQYGLGACLMQEGHPILFASRVMSSSELNYSQIEKETLAIHFACSRFHYHIYGRRVQVQSDHKPLQTVFKQELSRIPSRLRRMRLQLHLYNLDVIHIPGRDLYLADFLSRHMAPVATPHLSEESEKFIHSVTTQLCISPHWLEKIKSATALDTTLKVIMGCVTSGWPKVTPVEARPYAALGKLISNDDGILLVQDKIIVPDVLRAPIMKEIHNVGHLGADKCKAKARQSFYWPRMSQDLECFVRSCDCCLRYARSNQRMPLQSFPISDRPWQRVGSDILSFGGKDYLVIYDSYSKWLELDLLTDKTAGKLVDIFSEKFSRYGIIEECVCDNVPYNSRVFLGFAAECGFRVTNSSPRYPRSNGLAEKAVSIAKNLMRKNGDMNLALLQYRNSPIMSLGFSPAQLFFGRRLRDRLPIAASLLDFDVPPKKVVQAKLRQTALASARFYNRGTTNLQPLQGGDEVVVEQRKGLWEPATIVTSANQPRSYVLETQQGEVLRRNRQHIRLKREQEASRAQENSRVDDRATTTPTVEEDHQTDAPRTSGRLRKSPAWMDNFVK